MLSGNVRTLIDMVLTNALDLATPEVDLNKSYGQAWANGTGADQVQQMFADTRTLAGSGTETLDLAGSLVGPLGNTLTFAAMKEIIVVAKKTNTGNLRVGKKVTNGFAGPFDQTAGALGVLVEPGGMLHLRTPSAAGWAVTAATADLLSVENLSAGASDYDVILIGE